MNRRIIHFNFEFSEFFFKSRENYVGVLAKLSLKKGFHPPFFKYVGYVTICYLANAVSKLRNRIFVLSTLAIMADQFYMQEEDEICLLYKQLHTKISVVTKS